MKSRNRIVVLATAITLIGQLAVAQEAAPSATASDCAGKQCPAGGRWKHHRGPNADRMAEKLGLNDAQKNQVKEILKAHQPQVQAIRSNDSLTPDAKRQEMKNVLADIRGKLAAVLTPEQLAKWDEMKKERREHGRFGKKKGGAEPEAAPDTSTE